MSRVILTHQSIEAKQIARLYPNTKWIFLGVDYFARKRWERVLGEGLKVNYKKLLFDISYQLRDDYVNLTIDIARPFWKHWQWWLTPLATRNTMMSSLYRHLCYLEVLKGLLSKREEPIIVVTENWALFKTIQKNWCKTVDLVCPFPLQQKCKRFESACFEWLRFFRVWFKSFLTHWQEWIASRRSGRYRGVKKDHVFADSHTVIHTVVNQLAKGKFKDHFYPGLDQFLRRKEEKVSILAWVYGTPKAKLQQTFADLRNAKESFLIPQDYYGLFDWFRSFATVIRSAMLLKKRSKFLFRDLDVSLLIHHENYQQFRNINVIYFLNLMTVFKKWKALGYKLNNFIGPWEFKYYETPTAVSIKQHYPQARIITHLYHIMIPKLLFANFKTTKEEFEACPQAQVRIVNSDLSREYLVKEGFPKDKILLGSAWRYQYLQKQRQSNQFNQDAILICIPLVTSTACEMLEVCYETFQNDLQRKIMIKLHPVLDFDTLRQRLSFTWPKHFQIEEKGIDQLFEQAKVVITCDSGTMVESVYNGISTVVMTKETDIDLNFLDSVTDQDGWIVVQNKAELKEAVDKLINRDVRKVKDVKQFFEFGFGELEKIL